MVEMLKTWWKARKIVKKPKIKFELNTKSKFRGYPDNRFLSFDSSDVCWKDKYGTPRFEFPPFFTIYLFGYFQIWIELDISDDFSEVEYWEQILWMEYYLEKDSERTLDEEDWDLAKKTWPWVTTENGIKKSTWNDEYHL